jgi:thiamine biosynthesis protein ThiS
MIRLSSFTVKITVNGEPMSVNDNCTVRQFLESRQLHASPCAVEVNRNLVPKRCHDQHRLVEGDTLEIVTLVGGG